MRMHRYAAVLAILSLTATAFGQATKPDSGGRRIYVPYADLAAIIDSSAVGNRAVLMDRAEFDKLLAAARAESATIAVPLAAQAAQVTKAVYTADVAGEKVAIEGDLTIEANTDRPVAMPLAFGQVGLTRLTLDGKPAPLGVDRGGLVLVVTGKGEHKLAVSATAILKSLAVGGSGSQFGMSMPAAVAGTLRLVAPGDLEVHSTAGSPVTPAKYDKQSDKTQAEIAIGGQSALTVLLLGNGRQEDARGILLGESATRVQLTPAGQELHCLYTVQIMRRGVRDLRFELPAGWTVTDVACANMLKWSIEGRSGLAGTILLVQLNGATLNTQLLRIGASRTTTAVGGQGWMSPRISLVGADFQRGYLIVDSGPQLRIRGQKLTDARQEDPAAAGDLLGALGGPAGLSTQWFYHWGENWSVQLDLAVIDLRRSSDERQMIFVTPEQIVLQGQFSVTAIGQDMFDVTFDLPSTQPDQPGWNLDAVTVNDSPDGFQYHLAQTGATRTLRVQLPGASPVRPEGVARIGIQLRHVPADWNLAAGQEKASAGKRVVYAPLIRPRVDSVSGVVGVAASGDIDVSADGGELKSVSVGRMASLGLDSSVRAAFTYEASPDKPLALTVSTPPASVSAETVGLVTVMPTGLAGDWRISYLVRRSQVRKLYLLADKSLGQALRIEAAAGSQRLASTRIVSPAEAGKGATQPDSAVLLSLNASTRAAFNLWELALDGRSGCPAIVQINVHYDRPLGEAGKEKESAGVPLVRPAGVEQANEVLGIQASEELALTVTASGSAREIDTIELAGLPASAQRLLAAYRLEGMEKGTVPISEKELGNGDSPRTLPRIALKAIVHDRYAVPPAVITAANLVTVLGPPGGAEGVSQATEAKLTLVNAGLQFLRIKLPAGAELWSIRLDGEPVKPGRDAEGNYLLALRRLTTPGKRTQEVRVLYGVKSAPGSGGNITLAAVSFPDVAGQINRATWTLIPPPGFQVGTRSSGMQAVKSPHAPKPACVEIARWLNESGAVTRGHGSAAPMAALKIAPTTQPQPDADAESRVQRVAPLVPRPERGGQSPFPKTDSEMGTVPGAVRLTAEGRYTLPVELPSVAGAGPQVVFAGFGEPSLAVTLIPDDRVDTWEAVGGVLAGLLGLIWLKRRPWGRVRLIVVLLVASTLAAFGAPGWPMLVAFANGMFYAAAALIPVYLLIGVIGHIVRTGRERANSVQPGRAASLLLLAAMLAAMAALTATAMAAAGDAKPADAAAGAATPEPPIIIPYDGDPTKLPAAGGEGKVLLPYDRFVELWNRAHPVGPLHIGTASQEPNRILVAGAKFDAAIEPGQRNNPARMSITLTATIRKTGAGWAALPMPMDNLAVTEATLDGQPVALQAAAVDEPVGKSPAPPGAVRPISLLLKGEVAGTLVVKAVATPQTAGDAPDRGAAGTAGAGSGSRRGSIELLLPPLPAGTMTLKLPADDLLLEADSIEAGATGPVAPVSLTPTLTHKGGEWTVPLNMAGRLALRWSPKATGGAADRTLSATATHSVYALPWALVGVSRLAFAFSAGDYDRFVVLTPPGVSVTDVSGPNVRDHQATGQATLDGANYNVIQVRLYKAAPAALARKGQEITVRWLSALPRLGEAAGQEPPPVELLLPRAGDVGRESGTLSLYAAAGMNVLVRESEVIGGKRTNFAVQPPPAPAGPATDGSSVPAGQAGRTPAASIGESAALVGQYAWEYRPFSIKVRLTRESSQARARLDQLVRVTDQVQLLAAARFVATGVQMGGAASARPARLFSASFILPDGFEVLNVTGQSVGEWYVQPGQPRRLHVTLADGQAEANFAVVCVRAAPTQAELGQFDVPMLVPIDADGRPLPAPTDAGPDQPRSNRLAVQIAPAMEAQTVTVADLKSLPPAALADWLKSDQLQAVRFAYQQQSDDPMAVRLRLAISPKPTKTSVELLASVAVAPAGAWYTYRLRYTISGSPVDHVSFDMPAEVSKLAAVNPTPAIRSVSQAELPGGARVRWTVWLVNEVTDTLDIMLNFVMPIEAATQSLPVPRITTTAPDGYRAIIVVANLSRHDVAVAERTNLSDLPASEQAKLLGAGQSKPVSAQAALQSFTDDWSMSLKVTQVQAAARAKAIVDLMAVTTVLDRSGQARYDVTATIQNHSEQFLPVRIPKGFKLWAAVVAGQAVRPVVEGPDDSLVLVPLVKTSPGGLPYDVRLYLAGKASEPLDRVTKLAPPPVRIEGIQVVRTTWSLRLPAEYSYFARGGNMSPLAGQAELESLKVAAQLDQLKRLDVLRQESFGSARSGNAINSWNRVNDDVKGNLYSLEKDITDNKRSLSKAELGRMNQKLAEQKRELSAIQESWDKQARDEAERTSTVFNYGLNSSTGGGVVQDIRQGTWESVRNKPLLEVPDFVQVAGQRQKARLDQELETAMKSEEEAGVRIAKFGAGTLKVAGGDKADTVDMGAVLALDDHDAAARRMLEASQLENVRQYQQQLKGKLGVMADNRMNRFYDKIGNGALNNPNNPNNPNGNPTAMLQSGVGIDLNGANQMNTTGTNTWSGGTYILGGNITTGSLQGNTGTTITLNGGSSLATNGTAFLGAPANGTNTLNVVTGGVNAGTNDVMFGGANAFTGNITGTGAIGNGGRLTAGGTASGATLSFNALGGGNLSVTGGLLPVPQQRNTVLPQTVTVGSLSMGTQTLSSAVPEGSAAANDTTISGFAMNRGAGDATGQPNAAGKIATAAGTFSLPVELPDLDAGSVQMDFGYPGGDAEVVVVAVHQDVVRWAWLGGAAVAICLAWVLFVIVRRVARRRRADDAR